MPRRLRRPAALLAPLLVSTVLVAGCGDVTKVDTGSLPAAEAYTLSGDFGTSPDVTWKGRLKAEDAESTVITTGDGAALADGDGVMVNYWVGNGFTEQTDLDTYAADTLPLSYVVGQQPAQPTTQDEASIARYVLDSFVSSQISAGDTVGTRKAVTVNSANVVGFGGGPLGIGNADGLLIVIDITAVVLDGPDGEAQKRSPLLPAITLAKSLPASLDFSKTPEPDGKLHTSVLVKGSGDEVKIDDLIVVNYLGQVYDAKKPFDQSYDRGTPFTTPIGQGAVVKGWDQALIGVPVGSRVLLEIPPDLGYGTKGSGKTIPGDSTLYFVIDVLAAA